MSTPIVDTHVHLWHPRRLRYPWLDGNALLNKEYGIAEFRAHSAAVNVQKMVFVQCDVVPEMAFAEVAYVEEAAREDARIEGIVAYAPIHEGAKCEAHLAKLAEHALVKGVRRLLQGESDAEFCLRTDFISGVKLLQKYGLSFDICIKHHQMAGVVKLVRQCPDVKFILDHIGKPDIKAGLRQPWMDQIKELAALPNVTCKISGLVTEADFQSWQPTDLRPYIDHVIASFGFERVMFAGDWPVALLASSYARWAETVENAVRGCAASDVHKLFYSNAVNSYRLSK